MWIRCTNSGTQSLKTAWMAEPVVFGDSGTAQVTAEVGERLCDEFEAIVPKDDGEQSESDE